MISRYGLPKMKKKPLALIPKMMRLGHSCLIIARDSFFLPHSYYFFSVSRDPLSFISERCQTKILIFSIEDFLLDLRYSLHFFDSQKSSLINLNPPSPNNPRTFPPSSRSSTTNLERPPARRLPLLGALLGLGPGAAQDLQEVGGASAHAAVDVRLAGLDVVVEVVAKGLDVRDDLLAARGGEVAGEEDCGILSAF